MAQKPIQEQGKLLDEEFENWRGSIEQIDDVCVIGVKGLISCTQHESYLPHWLLDHFVSFHCWHFLGSGVRFDGSIPH